MKKDFSYDISNSTLYNHILNSLYSSIELLEDIVKEEYGFCCICGNKGRYVIDPFSNEIYDKTIYMCLCEKCFKEREEDI